MPSVGNLRASIIFGLAASLFLAAGKLLAGILGNSSALIADSIESFADAIGSIIVWHGVRLSDKPPDEDHPYGHGKAEALAALGVGGLLLIAAVFVAIEAFQKILTPHEAPAEWTLWVLIVVIVVKETLFRVLERKARDFESTAVHADAWHHRSDAITSAAAFVGVSIAIWGPRLTGSHQLVLADEGAALVASGIIVMTAFRLVLPSLHELLDAAPHGLIEQIRSAAAEVPGVRLVEKVHARKSGRQYHVDLHLHVAGDLNVREAHALGGRVKAHLRARLPSIAAVLTHIEPAET